MSPGTVETLTLQGPNNEAITFESRFRGFNQYEDGLPPGGEGLLAWFRKTDSSGEPLVIPSLPAPTPADCLRLKPTKPAKPGSPIPRFPTCGDRAVFSLAPVSFQLDPNDVGSRGRVGPLGAGDYRVVWFDGTDSGFLIRVEPGFLTYTVSWSHSITIPPLLPPIFLPTLPPWPGPFPASP